MIYIVVTNARAYELPTIRRISTNLIKSIINQSGLIFFILLDIYNGFVYTLSRKYIILVYNRQNRLQIV